MVKLMRKWIGSAALVLFIPALASCSVGGTAEPLTEAVSTAPQPSAEEMSTVIESTEDTSCSESERERPHLVDVDGELYSDMGYVDSAAKCGVADGKATPLDETFGGEYDYQRIDNMHISVYVRGKWHVYVNVVSGQHKFPSVVANFKAGVISFEGERLLVTMTEFSDDFRYLLSGRDVDEIKPISLGIDKLVLPPGQTELSADALAGKTVHVWFDGVFKGMEPEMSYPLELGEIYLIILEP